MIDSGVDDVVRGVECVGYGEVRCVVHCDGHCRERVW